MKALHFCFFLLLVVAQFRADAQSTSQQLERYLKQVKSDNTTPLPPAILSDFQSEKILLEILFSHRNDAGEQFQFRILDLIRLIGLKSKKESVRQSAASHFVNSVADKNLRISGIASQSAAQFLKPDFSETNKDSLLSYLRVGMPNLDVLFRLSGFLEIPTARDKISSMLIMPMSPLLKWNARLALARMNDDNAVNFILDKISTTPVDDSFVSSLVPGLVYTRNRKVFDQLVKILESDNYQCRSSHPSSQKTVLCAYGILQSLAHAIEKFPVKVDESGDLIVDNYQTALETSRRWLKEKPDYKLRRDTM